MNRKQRRTASKEGKGTSKPVMQGGRASPADPLSLALQHYQGRLPNGADFAQLGNALRDQGKLDEAAACFRQALAFQPDFVEALNNLGGVLDLQGKLTQAIEYYRRALALSPNLANVHYNLGNALREQGKDDEALASYERAAALGQSAARHMAAALTGETTKKPPREYIINLFDGYAGQFESHLVNTLGYDTPQILRGMVVRQAPGRRFARAVDLGCGTGLVGAAFRGLADHLTGVDLAPRMIERSAEKGIYDRLATAEIVEFLEQESGQFDLFLAAEVLIYLGALDDLFQAIAHRAGARALFAFSAEVATGPDYQLLDSGRYAQSRAYLEAQLARVGGEAAAWEIHPIRAHRGQPLNGYHVVAAFNAH